MRFRSDAAQDPNQVTAHLKDDRNVLRQYAIAAAIRLAATDHNLLRTALDSADPELQRDARLAEQLIALRERQRKRRQEWYEKPR
ncbi:MAG TPA: hypothetical protein VGN72_03125 [Tepidisphaeraceae bacterium]|jgi:hypothetical protein|nr:hypothetical protein [Tepidisphaeraceae bacterium]